MPENNFEWIDCNKFIPDRNGEYLTVRIDESGHPYYDLCHWNGYYKTFTLSGTTGTEQLRHPTHWAKLPPPPTAPL